MAKTCVGAAVPFAILTNNLACPSFSCYHGKPPHKPPPPLDAVERIAYSLRLLEKCDHPPAVLVSDPQSALGFLEHRQATHERGPGDILLFDEPTADVSSAVARAHSQLLMLAPPLTVLMSATLPSFEDLHATVAHFRRKCAGALSLRDIASRRIVSPCTVVDARGTVYAPHRVFSGVAPDLARLLRANLHLLRMYSPRAVLQLFEDLPVTESAARELVEKELGVPDALSFARIRSVALRLLDACSADCRFPCSLDEYECLDQSLLCTSAAAALPGTTIFLSEDADCLRRRTLCPLLKGADRLTKRISLLQQEAARLSTLRVHDRTATRAGKERETRLDRSRRQETMLDEAQRTPLWPPVRCINTVEHRKHYAPACLVAHVQCVPLIPEDVLTRSCEELVEGMLVTELVLRCTDTTLGIMFGVGIA